MNGEWPRFAIHHSPFTLDELFSRLATYQNGAPNTLNGAPTSGTWGVGDYWRD